MGLPIGMKGRLRISIHPKQRGHHIAEDEEARRAIESEESKASTCERHALKAREMNLGSLMQSHTINAEAHRDEAAHLRILLPTLPD